MTKKASIRLWGSAPDSTLLIPSRKQGPGRKPGCRLERDRAGKREGQLERETGVCVWGWVRGVSIEW